MARDSHKRNQAVLKVGKLVLKARSEAGLSQAALAKRIGTTQSAIARLESADYNGHSVLTLQRVAKALNLDLQIVFSPHFEVTDRSKEDVCKG